MNIVRIVVGVFDGLKVGLVSMPVLQITDFGKPFVIETDAL